ncbi:MAG: HD domain-containing protein [Candidatus Kuenenia sp.]|nr:HD domain-containing protein [Candidatus Kuenenia hertensis]
MQRGTTVNLGNLILSLSDAMDYASSFLVQHQQRVAFIVWEMSRAANLPVGRTETNFVAALLHDIGAFSVEEKIAIRNIEIENIEDHSIRGALLLENIPLLKGTPELIRAHHKAWKHWKEPIETSLVFDSQLLHVANYLECLIDRNKHILHQNEDIISKINTLSGSVFHPQIIDLLNNVSKREEFWLDIVSPRLYSVLLHEGPYRRIEVEISDIVKISELFRNIIDFRSRFTATHSSGVATAASILAKTIGLTDREIELMYVAGNLHDLGKLAIPNAILDKPGKLDKKETATMKSHTYFTFSILKTIGNLKQIAEWAAYHHEFIDGSGYPFHCKAEELDTGSRIMMVADVFTALEEDRPYRKGMSKENIINIIRKFAEKNLFDAKIVGNLFENFDEIYTCTREKQAAAKEFYKQQFKCIERR